MNIDFAQYRHMLTGKNIITGLAGIFAVLSIENVTLWFKGLGHPFIGALVAGLAIGSALVVLAHQLSGVSYRDGKAFWGLLSVTLVLVTLSGGISGSVYAKHLGWFGYVMAFVIAITGEIALPMAHGWYEESQRNKAVVNAGIIAEQKAAQTLIDTFDNLDTTKAKRAAERRIESLIVANVDDIVRRLMPTAHVTAQEAHSGVTQPIADVNAEQPIDNDQTPNVPATLDTANAKRKAAADARRHELLHILQSEFNGADADSLNKTQLAGRLDTTRQTISRDLSALQDSGFVNLNGVVRVAS